MKKILFIAIIGLIGFSASAELSAQKAGEMADAIKKIENSKKYPYGIKSINTHGDEKKARRICLNTINNNYARWEKAGKPGEFLDYLGNVYCPFDADPTGNKNWKKNIKKFIKSI